jgi:general stress protein YciG
MRRARFIHANRCQTRVLLPLSFACALPLHFPGGADAAATTLTEEFKMASNNQGSKQSQGSKGSGERGFAGMSDAQQREIARMGGEAVSEDREHMAEIGRKGGEASGQSRSGDNSTTRSASGRSSNEHNRGTTASGRDSGTTGRSSDDDRGNRGSSASGRSSEDDDRGGGSRGGGSHGGQGSSKGSSGGRQH